VSDRTRLRRKPDRADQDPAARDAVLDEGLIAHVGLVAGASGDPHPVVIPMLYARDDDRLILHGSPASRLLRTAKQGVDVCVTVTLLDALVLARSALNHSMNYRSVVVIGRAVEITDHDEKRAALDRLTDQTVPGQVAALRPNSDLEVKGTTVLSLPMDDWSMKVRSGPPVDEPEDLDEPVWAGLIPLGMAVGDPEPDEGSVGRPIPAHVADWVR
jgi:hypothetical protein